MTKEKDILEKLIEEVIGQYFRLRSAYYFYRDNNVELLDNGVDAQREELRKIQTEPVKSEGLSPEQIKEANYKLGVRINDLSSEIDHYDRIVKEMESVRNNMNETVFHYEYLNSLISNEDCKIEKIK